MNNTFLLDGHHTYSCFCTADCKEESSNRIATEFVRMDDLYNENFRQEDGHLNRKEQKSRSCLDLHSAKQ